MISTERPLAYMVALDLAGRRCVVFGGDATAAQRVGGLLGAGARVTVVAERLDPTIRVLADRGDVEWAPRGYREGDLDGAFLAINTSADPATEHVIHAEAKARGVLLNTVDRPSVCDFAAPAVIRRDRLQIAVSTSGDSPFIAATVRERLDLLFGHEWGPTLSAVGRLRRRMRRRGVPIPEQVLAYRRLVRSFRRTARRGTPAHLPVEVDVGRASMEAGTVHLVGAGPGDPGLLTISARELLFDADIVFHDALVSHEILDLCGGRTRLVDVGKRGGGLSTSQDDIIELLIDAARSGLDVVRLKGGDPFIFGRGGEELCALRAAGVAVEVVPGISSALAAPAAAEIPLTFRGVSGSVAVVGGHGASGNMPDNLELVAAAVDTLVVLMPLGTLESIRSRLTPVLGTDWPAAIIAGATTPGQKVVRTRLGDLSAARHAHDVVAPATVVLGRVVDVIFECGQEAAAARDSLAVPSPAA